MININSDEYRHFLRLVDTHQRYAKRERVQQTIEPLPVVTKWGRTIRAKHRKIHAFGESLTAKQWAKKTGINIKTIENRIDRLKWDAEQALTVKPKRRGK